MSINTKIIKCSLLKKKVQTIRKNKRTIAFTNGCFDILHLGHVSYLQEAKKTADVLIVGLNSDRSVKKIKGPNRPIVDEESRAAVLAAFSCIDYVVIFNEETPMKLIEAIKPDILIKGADWKGRGAIGSDYVRTYGGKVRFIKYIKGLSSTKFINGINVSARTKR